MTGVARDWREAGPAELRDLLAADPDRERPLFPAVRLCPHLAGAAGSGPSSAEISGLVRRRRQQAYGVRVAGGWKGPRLLSKGDGWMLFPLVRDLVAQLEADHAIWCLSAEDDPLEEGPGRLELGAALVDLRPDALLLGAGGSQLFDPARIRAFLKPGGSRDARDPLFGSYVESFLTQDLMPRFRRLLADVRRADARVPVLLHGYAPPLPRAHGRLARTLAELGLEGSAAREAMQRLVSRYHGALERMLVASGAEGVELVDCRALVGRNWFDELHPNDRGFAAVADAFRARIAGLA